MASKCAGRSQWQVNFLGNIPKEARPWHTTGPSGGWCVWLVSRLKIQILWNSKHNTGGSLSPPMMGNRGKTPLHLSEPPQDWVTAKVTSGGAFVSLLLPSCPCQQPDTGCFLGRTVFSLGRNSSAQVCVCACVCTHACTGQRERHTSGSLGVPIWRKLD